MATLLNPTPPFQVLRRFGQGVFSILSALWMLLVWPLHLLLQKRVLTSCCVTLLVSCTLWLAWAFCTTGVHGLAMKVKQGSEWVNRITVIVTDLREGKPVSWERPATTLTIRNSTSAVVFVDSEKYDSSATQSRSVNSGLHTVEVKADRTRYRSDVSFPPGGSVGIESRRGYSSTILAITVEIPDDSSRVSQDHSFSAGPVEFETTSAFHKANSTEH